MFEGVIALIDALGIKGSWTTLKPEDLLKSWENTIVNFYRSITSVSRVDKDIRPYFITVSDTIIIILKTDKDAIEYIPLMAEILMNPFTKALQDGIFFRGVISFGKLTHSEKMNMIIGPAIDEADDCHKLTEWIGVSLTPSAEFGLDSLIEQGVDVQDYLVPYTVPMKDGVNFSGRWALAWPQKLSGVEIREKSLSPRAALLHRLAKSGVKISHYKKCKNTIDFYDACCKQKKTCS